MTVYLTCAYCNHRWEDSVSYYTTEYRCVICGDKNIKVEKEDSTKGDYFGYNNQEARDDAYFRKRK